jgi:hypothetical protein
VRFEGNYIRRGTIDIVQIADAVTGLSEDDWLEDRYRQSTFVPHRDTQTVPLLFDADFRHTGPTKGRNYQRFSPFLETVRSVLAGALGPGGWLIRALFARLPPGGTIPPHTDRGFSLTNSHRLHIPVVTNEAAGFSVGDEERHLRCGEIWEINNQRRHAAWNRGARARIHLICDWVSGPGDG